MSLLPIYTYICAVHPWTVGHTPHARTLVIDLSLSRKLPAAHVQPYIDRASSRSIANSNKAIFVVSNGRSSLMVHCSSRAFAAVAVAALFVAAALVSEATPAAGAKKKSSAAAPAAEAPTPSSSDAPAADAPAPSAAAQAGHEEAMAVYDAAERALKDCNKRCEDGAGGDADDCKNSCAAARNQAMATVELIWCQNVCPKLKDPSLVPPSSRR
ncbi:hypothetical protein ACP4OV_009616 [Aristida adscensionis]